MLNVIALIVKVPALVLPVGLLINVATWSNVTVFIVQSFMVATELADIVASKLMSVVCPAVPPAPNVPPVISTGNIFNWFVTVPYRSIRTVSLISEAELIVIASIVMLADVESVGKSTSLRVLVGSLSAENCTFSSVQVLR